MERLTGFSPLNRYLYGLLANTVVSVSYVRKRGMRRSPRFDNDMAIFLMLEQTIVSNSLIYSGVSCPCALDI